MSSVKTPGSDSIVHQFAICSVQRCECKNAKPGQKTASTRCLTQSSDRLYSVSDNGNARTSPTLELSQKQGLRRLMEKVVKACLSVEPFAKRQKMFEVLAQRVGSGSEPLVALLCQETAHPTKDNASLVLPLLRRLPAELCAAFLEKQTDPAFLWCWHALGLAPPSLLAVSSSHKYWPAAAACNLGNAAWGDALQWLSVGVDLALECQNNFDRSFLSAGDALNRSLEVSSDSAIFECLQAIFQLLVSAKSCPGLSIALGADKLVVAAPVACAGAMASSTDIQMAALMAAVSQMPMRPHVCVWFRSLFETLRARNCREAQYRVTFEGALENLVLQLFVPSCRRGALEMASLLLYGFQTSPAAFHSCLPALRHVFSYLEAEKQTTVEACSEPRNAEVSGLFCVSTMLRSLETAPVFDSTSPMTDVTTFGKVDVLPQLAVLLYDLMTFHSGFLDYYTPVMQAIIPHLSDPDYVPDLKAIRAMGWTGDSEDGGLHSSSSSSASSLSGPSASRAVVRTTARAPGMGVGLANLGNTCYANSLVQSLHYCTEFGSSVSAVGAIANRIVCRELSRVFALLSTSTHSFAPREFLKVLPQQYRVGEQQDVAEFGKQLLDLVEREMGNELSGSFFTGKLCSEVTCCSCGTKSERFEPFTDLSLSFPPAGDAKGPLQLEEMLEYAFSRKERMSGDNKYNCGTCKRLEDADLSVAVATVPNRYLMITLSRFIYEQGQPSKNCRNVRFGERTQVKLRDGSVARYRLIAVIFHSGTSVSYGHYYAFARGEKEHSHWQLFNDEMVQRASFSQIQSTSDTFPRETAYVLWYCRELD